jgi:hypothetical protein
VNGDESFKPLKGNKTLDAGYSDIQEIAQGWQSPGMPVSAKKSQSVMELSHGGKDAEEGMLFRTDGLHLDVRMVQSEASLAQSSPSIYPMTLPEPENELFDAPHPGVPPPRPPRSRLRAEPSVIDTTNIQILTPPASVSSHEMSRESSPVLFRPVPLGIPDHLNATLHRKVGSQDEILSRRTLLNVSKLNECLPFDVTSDPFLGSASYQH